MHKPNGRYAQLMRPALFSVAYETGNDNGVISY